MPNMQRYWASQLNNGVSTTILSSPVSYTPMDLVATKAAVHPTSDAQRYGRISRYQSRSIWCGVGSLHMTTIVRKKHTANQFYLSEKVRNASSSELSPPHWTYRAVLSLLLLYCKLCQGKVLEDEETEFSCKFLPFCIYLTCAGASLFEKTTPSSSFRCFTPIHVVPDDSPGILAAREGDLSKLQLLISTGRASISDTTRDGWTLLHVSKFCKGCEAIC